jgi:hypothetical protein
MMVPLTQLAALTALTLPIVFGPILFWCWVHFYFQPCAI